MIIVTSISPGHRNAEQQHLAIESWKTFDCIVYSMNTESEIQKLKGQYDIKFIETHKTIYDIVGKPMVSINAMIDVAIEKDENLMLINSDIILKDVPELKTDGITLFVRYDYEGQFESLKMFIHGYDVFFIPKQFLKIFPPSIYAMGVSHWDHFVPLRAIQNNIPIYISKGIHSFHKWHETQYHYSEWEKIGQYFKLDFGFDKNMTIGQIATATMEKIKSHLIEY